MPSHDPETRSLTASVAAHAMHAKYSGRPTTAAGRAKFMNGFLEQVDPDHKLGEEERIRRADHALQARMIKLNLRAKQARDRRKAEAAAAADGERVGDQTPSTVAGDQ